MTVQASAKASAQATASGTGRPDTTLTGDAALWRTSAAAATALVHAAGPALRAAGEAQLVAHLGAAHPERGLALAVGRFLVAETVGSLAAGSASAWATRAWQASARRRYDAAYLASEAYKPGLWAMGRQLATVTQTVRQVRTNLFAERLRWGVDNEVRAISELLRLAVGLGCNAVFFAHVLGRDVTAALLVGVALACGFRLARLSEQSRRTESARDADREVAAHRSRAWDNVVLGNANNHARWAQVHGELVATQTRRNAEEAQQKSFDGAVEAGLALAPLAASVYRQLLLPTHDASPATVAAARATLLLLPVAFRAAREATGLAAAFSAGLVPARKSLLERTLRPARAVPGCTLDDFIDEERVVVHGPSGAQASLRLARTQLEAAMRRHDPAFFELRGPNGSGKSMFLLALKQMLAPNEAELLPADRAGLMFSPHTGSSSASDVHAFNDLVCAGAPVLLLDETEANLDVTTRANFRARLQALARPVAEGGEGRSVVLVSHV